MSNLRGAVQASFEILSLLNKPEFVDVRTFIEKNVKGHENLSAAVLYENIISNKELSNAVTVVLGVLEDASIAIQVDYVDEEILFLSLSEMTKRVCRGLRGYIEQIRKHSNTPEYYIEVEKMVKEWENKRKLSDGESIACINV